MKYIFTYMYIIKFKIEQYNLSVKLYVSLQKLKSIFYPYTYIYQTQDNFKVDFSFLSYLKYISFKAYLTYLLIWRSACTSI